MQIIIKIEKWNNIRKSNKSKTIIQRPNIKRHKWWKHTTKDVFKGGNNGIQQTLQTENSYAGWEFLINGGNVFEYAVVAASMV